jgi:hypothetical protein
MINTNDFSSLRTVVVTTASEGLCKEVDNEIGTPEGEAEKKFFEDQLKRAEAAEGRADQ